MKLYVALFAIGFVYDLQFVLFLHLAQTRNLWGVALLTFIFYASYDAIWIKAVKSDYTIKAAVVHALGYAIGAALALYWFPLK